MFYHSKTTKKVGKYTVPWWYGWKYYTKPQCFFVDSPTEPFNVEASWIVAMQQLYFGVFSWWSRLARLMGKTGWNIGTYLFCPTVLKNFEEMCVCVFFFSELFVFSEFKFPNITRYIYIFLLYMYMKDIRSTLKPVDQLFPDVSFFVEYSLYQAMQKLRNVLLEDPAASYWTYIRHRTGSKTCITPWVSWDSWGKMWWKKSKDWLPFGKLT